MLEVKLGERILDTDLDNVILEYAKVFGVPDQIKYNRGKRSSAILYYNKGENNIDKDSLIDILHKVRDTAYQQQQECPACSYIDELVTKKLNEIEKTNIKTKTWQDLIYTCNAIGGYADETIAVFDLTNKGSVTFLPCGVIKITIEGVFSPIILSSNATIEDMLAIIKCLDIKE